VGKVDMLTLRPMNFSEFLRANGETLLCDYVEKLPWRERISPLFAEKLETYLRNYYVTGGMPEAVATWIDTHDVAKVELVHQKILDSYELDFAKHAPTVDHPKLSAIWRSIPDQLAKENGKFIFSRVSHGARAKDLEDALEWLLSAGLAYQVAKVSKPFLPLSAYADRTFFKLYMTDIGLLRKMSGLPASAVFEKTGAYKEFKGALTENYVLTELVNTYGTVPFYWKSDNTAEVDFVIQNNLDIVPIEVKAEQNTKAKSLAVYRQKYAPRLVVKTSMNNGEGENVPLYRMWALKKMLNPLAG
jgi:predicted AAA+ superfamily ATPase